MDANFVLLKGTRYNTFSLIMWSRDTDPKLYVIAGFQCTIIV